MKKSTSGRFSGNSNSGIYIYDDSTFALFGYASLVWGRYVLEDNEFQFTPTISKQGFTMLGRNDKNISGGAQLTFNSAFVSDGPTYMKLDNDEMSEITNQNMTDISGYYTVALAKLPDSITLYQNTANHLYRYNTSSFNLKGNFNNYLIIYDPTISAQKPFSATMENDKNIPYLNTNKWGSFKKIENSTDNEWDQFLLENKQYKEENKDASFFYFNDELKSATGYNHLSEEPSTFSIDNYILDDASNKYILKSIYKKGRNYKEIYVKDYHDESYMMRYDDIPVAQYSLTDFGKLRNELIEVGKLEITEKADRNEELPKGSTIKVEPQEQYPISTIPPVNSKKKKD